MSSCSRDKIDLEGKFIKVLSKNKKYNIYTFDFNETINIDKNGDNYLITDKNGNKSIGTFENNIISYNNCKILIDIKHNLLIKTCNIKNKSFSNDYWPQKRVAAYLSNLKDIKYKEFINDYLSRYNGEGGFKIKVPEITDLNEKDKAHLDKSAIKTNPNYPFIALGDFNNDNKYPDIATITYPNTLNSLYEKEPYYMEKDKNLVNTSLGFFYAGSSKLIFFNFKEFYPFIDSDGGIYINKNNEITAAKNLRILNLKDWSGWDIKWNGRRHYAEYVNLH